MATSETTNLHLVKPDYDELADIAVINENMDTIDGAIGDVQDSVSAKAGMRNATSALLGRGASATGNCIEVSVSSSTLGKSYTLGVNLNSIFLWDNSTSSMVWSIRTTN